MFEHLVTKDNDGKAYVLRFVTASEAYNRVKAAEAGKSGKPNDYRDHIVKPYANSVIKTNTLYSLDSWLPDRFKLHVVEKNKPAKFEFKHQVLQEFETDDPDALSYDYHANTDTLHLTVEGEGKCSFRLKNPTLKKCFVNGKTHAAGKNGRFEVSLTDHLTQIKID